MTSTGNLFMIGDVTKTGNSFLVGNLVLNGGISFTGNIFQVGLANIQTKRTFKTDQKCKTLCVAETKHEMSGIV